MAVNNTIHEYEGISRYIFGINAVKQVGTEAKELTEGRNCLIITDPGVKKAGLVDKVKAPLEKEGFHADVYAEVVPEPTLASAKAVIEIARDKKSDILIGLGGGSSMDTAKVASGALASPGSLDDYIDGEFPTEGIPVITIPTTSGTGAEVTPDCVLRLPEQRVKTCFGNARAKVAIVDPTMVLKLPPRLTAATGMDALSHAIESALAKLATPFTHALALESIRLISENLRKATSNGSDLEARTKMSWATLVEGFSEGNAGDVEAHGIGHITGPYYGIHHGEACGIALPYCMEFNLPVSEAILARIAEAMDKKLANLPAREAAEKGICAVKQLIEDIGLPSKLAGVKNASIKDIPELVELYQSNPNIVDILEGYTKRVATREEVTELFENMFNGVLKSKA